MGLKDPVKERYRVKYVRSNKAYLLIIKTSEYQTLRMITPVNQN